MRSALFFAWNCLEHATAVFFRVEIEPTLVFFESPESANFMHHVYNTMVRCLQFKR